MALYVKEPFDVDNSAFVDIVVFTYCNLVVVYEDARAGTTDYLFKGASHATGTGTKVSGEKVEFRGHFSPGETVGSIKCVSAVTASFVQEEDIEV